MPENDDAQVPAAPEIQARLRDIAGRLRQVRSLEPQAQRALAELVDELTHALKNEHLPADELTHLAQTTSHLEEVLQDQQDLGVIGKARQGLERTVESAEATAPMAVGLARRLLDVLANIGI